jgi:Carboxypeptidase regulatory-like domain
MPDLRKKNLSLVSLQPTESDEQRIWGSGWLPSQVEGVRIKHDSQGIFPLMKGRGCVSGVRLFLFVIGLAAGTAAAAWGQELTAVPAVPPTQPGEPVTVAGVVLNASTGQPLRRALVKVNSEPERGALTDGEGHFEIHGVPTGLQNFEVIKPGFQEGTNSEQTGARGHSVKVASGMADLRFSMAPENAISGHVTLSTGAPALGIDLTLVRQTIVDGRVGWEGGEDHQTTPDGNFRFAGLSDGTYLLRSRPEFDSSLAAEPRCNADAPAELAGYASEFYTNAVELSGAARVVVSGGQTVEVNLALNQTTFHMVQANVVRAPVGTNWEFTQTLLDHSGEALEYPIHQEKNHSLCVYLPDGSYTLLTRASTEEGAAPVAAGKQTLFGLLDFSVDGQPARNLRVALTPAPSTPVHLHYEPGPPAPSKVNNQTARREEEREDNEPLTLSLVRAKVVSQDRNVQAQAIQTGEGTYELEAAPPGAYWVQASASQTGVCAGVITAGGQNLARSPWVAGPNGEGPPIEVVLRTDCAKLTVQMPATLSGETAGDGANLYVFVIPEFDSIDGVYQRQLEQFGERAATFEDMTPGPYRVFAFRTQKPIEFRNPAALNRLGAGQRVTMEPGGSAILVLEETSN